MIKVFSGIEELNNFAAEKLIEICRQSIEKGNQFSVALSGGSTPKALYQLLAGGKFKAKVEWDKVFFFFGDERNVLPDDKESNFRMANENLFLPLQIPDNRIFRWKTEEKDAEKIAEDYEAAITSFFGLNKEKSFPRFDLILLGMGPDAHTASLFPFTEALQENDKIAVSNYVEKLQTTRLTLTFPVINNAANIVFLAAGAEKAEPLREVLEGEFEPEKFPSQKVHPLNGNLFWLIDEKAAALLSEKNL